MKRGAKCQKIARICDFCSRLANVSYVGRAVQRVWEIGNPFRSNIEGQRTMCPCLPEADKTGLRRFSGASVLCCVLVVIIWASLLSGRVLPAGVHGKQERQS